MKVLETEFNGQLFRSRLEARWAIFFWLLNIEYQYEPEGYRLVDGTQYLPDFYLPRFNRKGLFVEVKPENDLFEKARVFGRERSILLLDGPPAAKVYDICEPSLYEELKKLPQEELLPEEIGLIPGTYAACFYTKYLPRGGNGDEYRLFCGATWEDAVGCYAPTDAIDLVRSARFENGSFFGFGRLKYGRPAWDCSTPIRIDQ